MNVNLNKLLVLAFLFFCGSLLGWCLELVYRRFKKSNTSRKWVNPGFLQGPYLPIYGFSLVMLFLLAQIPLGFIEIYWLKKVILFIVMALGITAMEYIGGLIFIKGMNIKLWDYSNMKGNINGIICPQFTFYWMVLSAIYYFLIHPRIINSIYWLADHQTFSFFVGMFYGVFIVDLCISLNIMVKIRQFARENQIQVRYEEFKDRMITKNENMMIRMRFMFPVRPSLNSFSQSLKEYLENERAEGKGIVRTLVDGTIDGTKFVADTALKGAKTVAMETKNAVNKAIEEGKNNGPKFKND